MTQQERDEIRALVMSFSTRISDLPEVQSLSDADYITVVQDDGSKKHSKKATFQALLQLLKIHYPDNNGAKYQGVAHPTDQNVALPIGTDGFWFAIDAGIYTNYGGITVGNCPKVIRYDVVSHEWSSDDLWGDINGTIGFRLKPGVTPNSLDTFRIPVRPNGSYLINVDSLPAGALGSTVVSEFDYDGNLLKRTELESLPLDFIPQTGTDYIQVTLGYNSSNPIDIEHSEVTMSSSVKVLIEGLYNFIVDVLQGEYEAKFDNIENDITNILSRLSAAESSIQQLRTDIEGLRDDIDGLSDRIDGIDSQIGDLNTGLNTLNTKLQETIDNTQLAIDGISTRLEDDEGYISELQLTARLFQVRLSDAEGNISTLRQTADEISAQVENAQGDIALLYIRADEIGTRVTNTEGDISTLTQRADEITAQVQNAQGDIATLQITATQISSTVQNMQGDMSVLEQTAQQISARVTNVEGDVGELYITANELGTRVTDAEGNISTLTQTSTALTARLEDAEGDITALEVTATGLSTRITNTEGDISTLQLTASSLESRIENAEGDISTLTQTAEGISARVSNAENDISELNITAGEISARVSDAEDNISALTIRADGIEARVSDNEDNIASLELTAEGLTTRVSNAEGNISTLQQTATSLTSRITDAEGDISTLEQTATSLTSRISTAEGNITTINQDIDSIELSVSTISTNLTNYEALTDAALSNLQDQIDGVIQTWYAEGVPTLSNYPANEWDADEKPNHIGDLYYDKLTGKAYRFMLDGSQEPPVYVWTLIADEDVAKALALAGEKKRVFVTTPYAPYDVGDLWVKERTVNNVTTREIYKCVTSRAVGDTININTDWVSADDYGYQVNKANLEVLTDKIVGKVTQITYNQDGTISSQSASLIEQNANEIKLQVANGAIDDALDSGGSINSALLPTGIDITNEKVVITANHFYLKGNDAGSDAALVLVYKDNVPKISVVNLDVTGVFQTTEWSTQVTNLNTTAQGYANTAESNANSYADGVGASTLDDAKDYSDDNLQLAKDYADNIETSAINTAEDYFNTIVYGNGGTAEHPTSGSILYTINNLGDEYTTLNNQINVGNNSLVSQINTLSGHLTDMGYLAEALLNGRTVIGGGLILSSLIQLGSNPGGQNWQVWSGINGVYDSSAYGNGIAAWYGGAMLDRHYSGNTDANRAARSLFRFDGSGYLANQKIRWDYDNNDVKLVIDGYVLTHEVQLGYTDQSDVWHTMAGISGSYDATDAANGYGIAAWYGGEKIDRKKTPSATNGATSLFRFDGSGYLANRQIEWGASGELIIHGQSTENPITIENAVLTQGNLSVTIGDLLELKSWFVKEAFTIPGDSTTHYRLKLVGSGTGIEGLHVEGHILSDNDQIVGSGTPGQGGGGGTATLFSHELQDAGFSSLRNTVGANGKMLVWSTSATGVDGQSGAWTVVDRSSVGVTTLASSSAPGLMSTAHYDKLQNLTQGITSITKGTAVSGGDVTTSGTAVTIKFPTIPTSLPNPQSLTMGNKTYNGNSAVTLYAEDIHAVVLGSTVGTVTITS